MFEKYLEAFNIFTRDEIGDFVQLTSKRSLSKGDYFIREDQKCKEAAFVISGSLRSFFISAKEEEITYCITFPNTLMTAYSSFISGQGTTENIQAITPVELLIIQKSAINDLELKNPKWVKFLKVIAEQQYIELEKRIFQLQKNNASRRYASLVRYQPEYIQSIPLQYLASYLGITQRHLSRIRRENSF